VAEFEIKRRQLFEFTDLIWWPKSLRSMITTFLHANIEKYKPYSQELDLITQAIQSNKNNQIIDLCSGNLGPWLHLKKQLEEKHHDKINIIFTDKYPNLTFTHQINEIDNFTYYPQSVDARDVPKTLTGTRTIFNGFHHFNPNDAQKIIDNSIESKQPIIIFELLNRNWKDILIVTIFTPFYIFLTMPFFMKLSFNNIFFTYIFPLFPITFTWDTVVSHLRCYSEKELENMIQKADKDKNYIWDIGKYRHGNFPVLYCIAYPKNN